MRLGVQEHLSTFVLNNVLFHKCNLWIYVIVSASAIHYVLVAVQSELYRTSTLLPQKETSSHHRKLSIEVQQQLLGECEERLINWGGIFSREKRSESGWRVVLLRCGWYMNTEIVWKNIARGSVSKSNDPADSGIRLILWADVEGVCLNELLKFGTDEMDAVW